MLNIMYVISSSNLFAYRKEYLVAELTNVNNYFVHATRNFKFYEYVLGRSATHG